MATRILTTGRSLTTAWDRLIQFLATWSPSTWLHSIRTFFWPDAHSLRERWLRLIWMPFWIGADLAPPRAHPRFKPSTETGPASRRLVSLLAAVRRRQMVIRFTTLVARVIALTLLIAAGWATWAAFGGPAINGDSLLVIGLGLLVFSLVFGWRHRPDLRDTARMLDRSFDLSDRMTTAIDHLGANSDRSAGKPHLAYLQIAEATNTVAILSRHSSLRVRFPVREIVLITGLALLFLALFLLRGTGTGLPGSGNQIVPAFVSAKDRLQQQQTAPTKPDASLEDAPSVADVQARADQSASAEEDLLTLADALDDNPLTSPIADSIRAGDYERAAAQMDAVASQVSQLPAETRGDLADQMDEAADAMTGEHPGLQDATEDAADGLRSDPQQAESSLSDLSEQISQTGTSIESQGELASDMRDAREAERQQSSNQDTRPEPGDTQSDAQGEQQIAGDGGDAAPGQNGQSEQGDQTGGSGSSESSNQSGQQDDPSEGASGGPPGSDQEGGSTSLSGDSGGSTTSDTPNGEGDGQSGSGNAQSGTKPDEGNAGGSSENAETGSGAGAGSGESRTNQSSSGADQQQPGTGSTVSPDPNLKDGSGSGPNGPDAETGATHSSITLSRSPDESGVQTGGASSSSSGSGSGAAAGAGSVSQGDVGEAGPDSNRVPEQYRSIVENYFTDEP